MKSIFLKYVGTVSIASCLLFLFSCECPITEETEKTWQVNSQEALIQGYTNFKGHYVDSDIAVYIFSYRYPEKIAPLMIISILEEQVKNAIRKDTYFVSDTKFVTISKSDNELVMRRWLRTEDYYQFFNEYRFRINEKLQKVTVMYSNIDSEMEKRCFPTRVNLFNQISLGLNGEESNYEKGWIDRATNMTGNSTSPSGIYELIIDVSDMGGFRKLSVYNKVTDKTIAIAEDVTGYVWLTNDILIYTASPIYGKPGLFLYDCNKSEKLQLVKPKNIVKGYPDGADFFELYGLKSLRFNKGKILYYYSNNVDSTDFSSFRTQDNLRGYMLEKNTDYCF